MDCVCHSLRTSAQKLEGVDQKVKLHFVENRDGDGVECTTPDAIQIPTVVPVRSQNPVQVRAK